MQWAVCILHFIELPFRDLFTHIDGTTSSPYPYTGLIVSKLPDYEKLSVVSFKPIKCDLLYYSADDLRKLSIDLRKYQAVVHSSIQRNANFGLPENVILAIMTDFRIAVRQDALNKIRRVRQDEFENLHHSIRYNIIPQLNFEAEDYKEMILLESAEVSITVPPVLRNASNEELIDKLSLPDNIVPE
ncbi:hypothetical protein AVEN_27953-1 [Araneus ventricosus]|uniref:Uncharacterized protein n=1 Tax=Araneus ventricosus TaxID=182803 RepID=A0A4Y2R6K6_ARAVE|nr:hypothetical protein AVEN_27953-1 [Araneus ventricosus]